MAELDNQFVKHNKKLWRRMRELLAKITLCRAEQDSAGTMFPPISRQNIPVQLRKHKPQPPLVESSAMPSVYSTPAHKHNIDRDGWPSGVTMFDPLPRDNLEQGAPAPTASRVDVGASTLQLSRNSLYSLLMAVAELWLSRCRHCDSKCGDSACEGRIQSAR